jgi:hypothetical protein
MIGNTIFQTLIQNKSNLEHLKKIEIKTYDVFYSSFFDVIINIVEF